LALERGKIAEAAVQLGNERFALASARVELEAQRTRLREEERWLADERAALAEKAKEAEDLKARAIDRMHKLRELLAAGKRFRAYAQSVPASQRGPAFVKANAAAVQLATATQSAAQDDAWLAAATAFRAGRSVGVGR
jgi:hypothetical protein